MYIKTFVTMFVILYSTRLVLNSLGEVDFGIFNIVGGIIAMLGFMNMAMASTMQRFFNYEEGKNDINIQKSIFNIGIVFHLVIAIILLIVFIFLGFYFFSGVLSIPEQRISAAKIVYGCLIVSTVFTVLTVPYDSLLNAHENMLYYSIVGIIESFLKLLAALYVVYTEGDKLIIYGILMAVVPIISLTLMRVYCHFKYEECEVAIKKHYNKPLAKEMISFASWNLLGTMTNLIGNYGNGIVLNHFFGAVINAAVGIANQVQGQLMVLSSGMMKALSPRITKEAGLGKTESMINYSYTGCKFSFFLFSFFAVPVMVEAPFLLKLWLKKVPEWSILFVQLQLLRAMLEQLTVALLKVLGAKNRIKEYNLISIFFNLAPLVVLFYLFKNGYPPYWYYVIAIFLMVCIESVIKLYLCNQFCGMSLHDYNNRVLFPCLIVVIVTLVGGIIPSFIMTMGIIRFILAFCFSSLFFLVISWAILEPEEKMVVSNFVDRLRKK